VLACLIRKEILLETSEWIECLKAKETPDDIERNLELEPGSFISEKKRKEIEK